MTPGTYPVKEGNQICRTEEEYVSSIATAGTDDVTASSKRPPLIVLLSLAPPDGTTKYVDQIVDGRVDEVSLKFFSWRAALGGGYDVMHIHWPELTIRGASRPKRFFRRRAADLLMVLLKLRRVPLVRTVHNAEPHELGNAAERRTLRKYDRATNLFIRLNPTTQVGPGRALTTILHGDYRRQFERYALPDSIPGHVLYFGIVRPYKAVPALVSAFRAVPGDELRLRIVGSPSVGQRQIVESAIAGDDRISAELRFVSDAELVDEIGRSELIVLPYSEMHNSGSILVAMSLARPVLAPATPANIALREEVGNGWVLLYEGGLTPAILEQAIRTAGEMRPPSPPRLDGREWKRLGEEHYQAYRNAIARVRR